MEVVNILRDLPKEVADIIDELEYIQAVINDADKVAEAEEDDDRRDRLRRRVMRLREATFLTEDVIDEYIICEEKQLGDPGCAALSCEVVDFMKSLILRIQIANKIRDVKSLVCAEREGFLSLFPLERTQNSSMASSFIEEMDVEVVGFEGPTDELINQLIEGSADRTVISVVGMAGVGKTTLAKQVFNDKKVIRHFDCHAWITVSQSYTLEGLLRNMLHMFNRENMELTPRDISTMDRWSLIDEVRNHLRQKRYVVSFDDVWNPHFFDEIEFALLDSKNGSRILITTRDMQVAQYCWNSFIYVLKPLSEEDSLILFNKRAFRGELKGCCPPELVKISREIVRKCQGLPLTIVAVGGLLSSKDKNAFEWKLFSQNLSLELDRNLTGITKILGLSYDDLPNNLKSCFLYFGMYPVDYEVKYDRLIRQWIAEGFVKHESGKTLEEVAEQYLTELVHRNLVQVSSFTIDRKVKRCRVHFSLHDMILRKNKDTGFCRYNDEHDPSMLSGMVRRLTVTTGSNDLIGSTESSHIRSILIITNKGLSEHFINRIPAKYMPLRVLDFEDARLYYVPENLGNLIYLKYLSLRNTRVHSLPKSIGELQNLETLDVRQTRVFELPKEISKLRKLRYLLANFISSIQLKDSLGDMTSLEKIHLLRMDDDGVVIRELGKLKKLRDLRITNFKEAHGNTLCSSVNRMLLLEKLHIDTMDNNQVIDLHFMAPLFSLRKLCLNGKLKMLPIWIAGLQNLVKLSLMCSYLTNDPLESLKDMPNLLFLSISHRAYEGETLLFRVGGFIKLKKLELKYLYNLNSIFIEKGALPSLEKLQLSEIPQLKTVPSGIQYLVNLEVLDIWVMPTQFEHSIAPNGGKDRWIVQHVPRVRIISRFGAEILEELYKTALETMKRPTFHVQVSITKSQHTEYLEDEEGS
ncbi:Disease resistance protein RPM1, partial [Mucuna pruriens]